MTPTRFITGCLAFGLLCLLALWAMNSWTEYSLCLFTNRDGRSLYSTRDEQEQVCRRDHLFFPF